MPTMILSIDEDLDKEIRREMLEKGAEHKPRFIEEKLRKMYKLGTTKNGDKQDTEKL